jgi:hypothetical protein
VEHFPGGTASPRLTCHEKPSQKSINQLINKGV